MGRKRKKLSISKRISLIYIVFLFITLVIFTAILQVAISYISMRDVEKELISNIGTIEEYIKQVKSFDTDEFDNLKLGYNIFYNILDEDRNILYTNKTDLPQLDAVYENKTLVFSDKKFKHETVLSYRNKKVIVRDRVLYIQIARSIESYFKYWFIHKFCAK